VAVSTRANSSSFQLKMKQMSAVAAMPGMAMGAMILVSVPGAEYCAAVSSSSSCPGRKHMHPRRASKS